MIEMRPKIKGFYKGFVYCESLTQAKEVKNILDKELTDRIRPGLVSVVKRGCSEYSLEYPSYSYNSKTGTLGMNYPRNWLHEEEEYDKIHTKKLSASNPTIPGLCLSDILIIQKWIDYSKGIKDPSAKPFSKRPIIYDDIFKIAESRKLDTH